MKKIIVLLFFLLAFGSVKSQTLDTSVWTPLYDAQGFYKNMVWNKVEWYGNAAYSVKLPMNMAVITGTVTANLDSALSRAWISIANFTTLSALLDSTVTFVRNFSEITSALDSTITFVRNFSEITSALDSTVTFIRNFSEVTSALDTLYAYVLSLPVVRTENTDTLRVEKLNELSIKKYSFRDTTSANQDTLSRRIFWGGNIAATADTFNLVSYFGFTKWFQVIMTTDDSIEVTAGTFQDALSDRWMIYPSESWTSEKFDISVTNNLLWKILGTGTASVRVRVWGY